MKMKCLKISFLFILFSLLLVNCSSSNCPQCEKYLKGTVIVPPPSPLVHPKPGISAERRRSYDWCELKHAGIQMINVGETWKIVIPSDALFVNETPELKSKRAEAILMVVADFINTYSTVAVQVKAYANKPVIEQVTKTGTVEDELTQDQAETVVHFLTCQKVDARLIAAIGRGSHDEIAWSGSDAGRQWNRRVEITFQYYHDSRAWY